MRAAKSFALSILTLVFLTVAAETSMQDPISKNWNQLDKIVNDAIADKAFPGAVILIGNATHRFYMRSYGHFTYDTQTSYPMTDTTLFDMASVTKVLATTSAVAQFYQRGELDLKMRISDMFPEYAQQGKKNITVENCLLHNSGLPDDPRPGYYSKSVNCPESSKYHPQLAFTCLATCFLNLMNQTLANPIGKVYVYSDMSMITLQYVIGRLARKLHYVSTTDLLPTCPADGLGSETCYFEAYVRKFVFERYNMKTAQFLPAPKLYEKCAPTWIDTSYRHELIQGVVSDSNAYAMGGVAGHAGMFATVYDVESILRAIHSYKLYNETTFKLFTSVADKQQSERALGWDTMAYGPSTAKGSCGTLSSKTFFHTGYTGTQCCNDPERKLYTIFLTNRVYPDVSNTKILDVRLKFNSKVREIFDS